MPDIDYTDVVDAIARLQLNYTKLAQQWYDVFLNEQPMDVTLSFYNGEGEEFEFTIPNRAKDRQFILNGTGSPILGTVDAEKGSLYQDTSTGEVYIKYGDDTSQWSCIITEDALKMIIRQIQGSPEGSEIAPMGTLCVDTLNGWMYMKRTSTGNTGWVRIDSYATSKITETFVFDHSVSSLVLSGACENAAVLSIYEDGVKLSPDIYSMPYGDNKTIILSKPINTPGEGETVQVMCEYFIDLHVAESEAEQRLVDYVRDARFYAFGSFDPDLNMTYLGTINQPSELPEDTSGLNVGDYYYCVLDQSRYVWNGTEWDTERSAYYYMLQAQNAYEQTEYDRETAAEYIREVADQEVERLQAIEINVTNTAAEMRAYIDENAAQFTAGLNQVYNYSQEVSEDRTAVANMLESVKQLTENTQDYAEYVEQHVNEFATKTELSNVQTTLSNTIETTRDTLNLTINNTRDELTNNINSVNEELTTAIENETSERQLNYTELKGTIELNQSSFENWIASHTDLGNFSNDAGYFNRENMPIGLNGIYQYSKNVEASPSINISVEKDCVYYAVDIGEYMQSVTHGDTEFDFTITPDPDSIDLTLAGKLHLNEYTENYDNVVSVFRCYLKNDSYFTPTINWDFTKIQWLGEEPELTSNKSYIVEFVSYDMMTSWNAHILGICQPAIEVDTFTATFTVDSSALAADDLPISNTSEVRMVAVINGIDFILDDVYDFDNQTGSITVPMEIERRFLGAQLTQFYMKSVNTPAFTRYYSNALTLTLAQNQSYTITCNTKEQDLDHSFILAIQSDAIEYYMRGDLSLEDYQAYLAGDDTIEPAREPVTQLALEGKFTFTWGNISPDTPIAGTYYYDIENNNTGVTFTFDVEDGVLVDPLISMQESNRVGNIKLRYAALAANECITSDDELDVQTDGTVYVNVEDLRDTWNS